MNSGYQSEFKGFCLALSLMVVLFSPNLTNAVVSFIPSSDPSLSSLLGYTSFTAIVFTLGIVVDDLIPSRVKDLFLYPRFKGRGAGKPGQTIFFDIACNKVMDDRFRIAEAQEVYGEIIDKIADLDKVESHVVQNAEWYKLYRKHCTKDSVSFENLGYLYSRAISSLSAAAVLLLLLTDVVGILACGHSVIGFFSYLAAIVFMIIGWLSARFKAKRLVVSVIACDLAERDRLE